MLFARVEKDCKCYATQNFTLSFQNTLLWFCCSDFLNASDKKSGPREFQKKKKKLTEITVDLDLFCSTSQEKAKSEVRACFSAFPKVCSISVSMKNHLADCVVAPCIIHDRMELQTPNNRCRNPAAKIWSPSGLQTSPISFSADVRHFLLPFQKQITDTFW